MSNRNIIKKEDLERLYLKEQKTDLEISKLYGCAKMTVYKTRKRFGIKGLKRWQRNNCNPNEEQLQFIYGSLLGDSSISNCKKGYYDCEGQYCIQHGKNQKTYLFWKYEKLKNLTVSAPSEVDSGKWRFRSFSHPFFTNLRKEWYPNGTKCVNRKILDLIQPLGLAIWYMDDGSLDKTSNFMKISTCSFSEKEHVEIIQWLEEKYSIKSHMKNYSGYRCLVIDIDSRRNFVNLVKPFVIPSMNYKITFREYHTWVN